MAEKSEAESVGDLKVPVNPSIPSSDETVWADVSSLLRLACNDLRNDELINGENFNLFAAMSALEIMDPKMDSGIVSTYYSVDEAIDNGAAPVPLSFNRTTDIQRVIDVMDHLLACEATWHKGGSLAQTILIHMEEDLLIMAYGLSLKGDGDEKCLSMLHAVEETISRQLKACKAPSSKKRALEVRTLNLTKKLKSRSAAPTPPRAIKLLSWNKAISYFQKLLHDLEIICSYSLDPVLENVLRFVVVFQKFQPDLVARAHIQKSQTKFPATYLGIRHCTSVHSQSIKDLR
ncbi:hypothetical protein ACJIZ3_020554 [Penstemon smallii]|uniref:Uncharacterized protein n=1 Tax=Penstemon smallii TaxID=265156 RepID=A0ABD3SIY1_9LAMI